MDGSTLTGTSIWEYDKANAVLLSGSGIARKPGAVVAYQNTEDKLALILTDGKVTGVKGAGRGHYTMATGTAAALNGKTYTYTWATTGAHQFVVNGKDE